MQAIGFIETRGMLPAIEAADAMLKAAEVRLLEKNLVGGGLVTITVIGEVAAVQASVDAAASSISRIPGAVLVSRHVIPRPDAEISRILAMIPLISAAPEADAGSTPDQSQAEEDSEEDESPARGNADTPEVRAEAPDPARLKKMNINKLRQFACTVEGIALSREQVASSGRNELMEAIRIACRQTKE